MKTIIFGLLAVAVLAGAIWYGEKNKPEEVKIDEPNVTVQTNNTIKQMEGLKIEDVVLGTGAEAVAGKTVSVHYTGTLTDGTKFDSSLDRGTPFSFVLGVGQVIRGWDEGVAGMKVGGERKLTIAPEFAYGAQAVGPIPPNSALLFTVKLLEVK